MFIGDVSIKKINSKEYELIEDLSYVNSKYKITALKNLKTDGASIPKIFWGIVGSPFLGEYTKAAIIHDALYASESLKRSICDDLFLEMMKELEVNYFKRYTMYYAVRSGGWIVWKNHKSEDVLASKNFIKIEEVK